MSIRIPRSAPESRGSASVIRKAADKHSPAKPATHFDTAAVTFLNQLAKHNDREWFAPRKQLYLDQVRAPMVALAAALSEDFAKAAPEFVRPPEKSIMRIYRDTRFAKDKRPFKTNVAAWFAAAGLEKTSGGGFYMHLSADEFLIAAGCYMPDAEQLKKLRAHIAENHARMRKLLAAPALKRILTKFEGLELSRPPKGYDAEHPALDLIRCRQWGVSASLPVEVALGPGLLPEVRKRFRAALPLVQFLNEALRTEQRGRQPAAFRLQ